MQRFSLYIWFCLSLCLPLKSFSQTLVFKNYSVNQGLASSTVYSILQDSKGFIWFATESGVNRFDGKNFELFTIDNGLSDNEVLQINEDSKGRIWFLTLNGKLSYYFNKKFHNPENDPLLKKAVSKASFVSFYEDSNHHLWFSTNQNKLLEISENQLTIHSSNKFPLINAFIFENQDGELSALNKGYLLVRKNNSFIKKDLPDLPVSSKAILHNKLSKSVKFISRNGIIIYKKNYTNLFKNLPENINSNSVGKFIVDQGKNLWISTMGNGIYLIKPGKNKAENHLKENIITDILQDVQGNIWVSTIGNGIFMLPSNAQSTLNFTVADGISSDAVHSVAKINGSLAIGLRNGKIDLLKGDKILKKYLKQSDYNPIKELYYDKEAAKVWFASNHQLGQIDLKTEKVSLLQEKNQRAYAIKGFSMSRSGKIALALASGIYLINNKNAPLIFDSRKAFINNQNFHSRAFAVYFDSNERLWLANINGLYCYKDKTLLYKNQDQFSQRITHIAELPDKTILCTTYGSGVLLIKNFKRAGTITTTNGLLSNICKKVYTYGNMAWIATSKGISKVDLNQAKISITNYTTENGLTTPEVNDLLVENDTVYAATNNGLSIFSANQHLQNQAPPQLYFHQFLANKKPVKIQKALSLPYQDNNITVNYLALDFEHPASLKYSYRLNPEFKWNETSNNTIEFASLQPGLYHLQVRAKSLNSDWSNPIEVEFTIHPPIWNTWWFITIAICLIGISLFLLINQYYKSKRAKENERLLTRTKIISLEQQALQAMMNPHFVFNVMNSIQYFINTKDNAMANQALTGFARLLRKNLENCNKSYITIEEEISYLNLYLSLEKMRFGDRMNYSITVDEEINKEETFIPSMLLQPYVENAIWHGLMPKESDGNIRISILKKSGSLLEIKITDDGIGIQNSLQQKTEGHISRGMQLTNERIILLNKFKTNPIQISVNQIEPEGTEVSINIPTQPFTH